MKAQAIFRNNSHDCYLDIQHHTGGSHCFIYFDSTSQLVNYCHQNHIEITLNDCHTED